MAVDANVTEQKRSADSGQQQGSAGPYIARVIKHADPQYLGGLEVQLLKTTEAGNFNESLGQTAIVYYASPFYGVTQSGNVGKNDDYANTQKSYGWWAIPPDPGSLVLVTFVEGTRAFGFWFACIPEKGMTFMLPGGQPTTQQTSGPVPPALQGKKLPAGEYNKEITKPQTNNPIKYKRPVNLDFVNQLIEQGTIEDEIRGTTSSSAQREFPSAVIGFSSPGPVDKRGGSPMANIGLKESKATMHVSRLGSSSIVIDDGDDKLIRRGPASNTPFEYVNKEANQSGGDVTLPHNELIRLRTRTGAQILMHTTEDLIYINNSKGTCWIEMTSNGKLEVYAKDSISFHSDNDINFKAERDINIHAANNINFTSNQNTYMSAGANWEVKANADGKITTTGTTNVKAEADVNITAAGTSNYKSGAETKVTAGGDFSIGATNTTISGGDIHLNGPAAPEAEEAEPAAQASVPVRVPQHEPWEGHENLNPQEVTPDKTQAKVEGE
jgi:hypothetical protein